MIVIDQGNSHNKDNGPKVTNIIWKLAHLYQNLPSLTLTVLFNLLVVTALKSIHIINACKITVPSPYYPYLYPQCVWAFLFKLKVKN